MIISSIKKKVTGTSEPPCPYRSGRYRAMRVTNGVAQGNAIPKTFFWIGDLFLVPI